MKSFLFTTTLLILIVFSSCISSLYPLSENNDDCVFKKELIGKWGYNDTNIDSAYLLVDTASHTGGKLYKITSMDLSDSGWQREEALAQLIQINNNFYIDYWRSDRWAFKAYGDKFDSTGLYLRQHYIMKMDFISKDSFSICYSDAHKVIDKIDSGFLKLKYTHIGGDIEGHDILLDKANTLQKALVDMEKFPGIFDYEEKQVFYRKK
jgi:hypothetical protein